MNASGIHHHKSAIDHINLALLHENNGKALLDGDGFQRGEHVFGNLQLAIRLAQYINPAIK
ncbi:MAG: hypothetical protein LBO00_06825 [Zoogloeaceae bacterium]|jgi:hypothetical protein|nr:hypothetical protein [Zoogloeaceae bacterium]